MTIGSWHPSRAAALRRLDRFVPHAGRAYAGLRNYDRGPGQHRDVSTLSPWIRHRLILEQEVVSAVLARHGFAAAEKYVQEVFWRTYCKGWLELRPAVWDDYRAAVRSRLAALEEDQRPLDRWQEATTGKTGIACFDAWSQELVATGYLHNHARMWFASIWIFTLELPWELGADFFLRHLLDGDPASNTLSWRWVAGLQTRGKTYLARPENIERFTAGRFKAVRGLSNTARPLEGPLPPPPIAPPQPLQWERSVATGLLLTEEDLNPESLFTPPGPYRGIAALIATGRRSPLGPAAPVSAFAEGAVGDALSRLKDWADGTVPVVADSEGGAEIVDWARALDLRQVVTAYAPVGPTAEALRACSEVLGKQGIRLIPVLRRWDHLAWPHATRGFFPFREKIPAILGALQT